MHHSPLIKQLRLQLGAENVISAPSELAVYDCDAFTAKRNPPEAVVFPRSTRHVVAAVKIAQHHGVPIVPRGSGTGLAGASLPLGRSLVLMLTRMNHVLEINSRDRLAVVESGVTNKQLNNTLAGTGFCFAPQPANQGAGAIGGNVATNAAGPQSLKYGATANHVLGLETVLSDGSILQLGPLDDHAGIDLLGLLVGSEGTLAIVTKVWLRLTPLPLDYRTMQIAFPSAADALSAASQIIAAGIIPTVMELIDSALLEVMEEFSSAGLLSENETMLFLELDGPAPGLDRQEDQIIAICKNNNAEALQHASPGPQIKSLWKDRQSLIGAIGRLSPNYMIADVAVPRRRLASMLGKIAEIAHKHQIRIVSTARLGDGSVYPIILYDHRHPESLERASTAAGEIITESLACGGTLSATHGVGVQKLAFMPRQFQPADLLAMQNVRHAFDPLELFNPGKLLRDNLLIKSLNISDDNVNTIITNPTAEAIK